MSRLFPNQVAAQNMIPDPELIKNYQFVTGKLSKDAFMSVILKASQVMSRESNLIRVDGKVVIFGDIHG